MGQRLKKDQSLITVRNLEVIKITEDLGVKTRAIILKLIDKIIIQNDIAFSQFSELVKDGLLEGIKDEVEENKYLSLKILEFACLERDNDNFLKSIEKNMMMQVKFRFTMGTVDHEAMIKEKRRLYKIYL